MNRWEEQSDGSYLACATEIALDWAGDDRHKLATLGFVAWCRDFNLRPNWAFSDWKWLTIEPNYAISVLLDRSERLDRILVPEIGVEEGGWRAVVRILEGREPVIHILGLTSAGVLAAYQRRMLSTSTPRYQLLSPREFLKVDPIHHLTPLPEATECQPARESA